MITKILLLPVRLTAGVLCMLRLTGRQFRGPRRLPVGGIDEVAAQNILSALREHDRPDVAAEWLRALQLAQIASDRIYVSRHHVLTDLKFWQARMSSGRQHVFMLLKQGPVHFAQQLLALVQPRRARARRAVAQIDAKITSLRLIDAALLEALATVHFAAAALAAGGEDLVGGIGSGGETAVAVMEELQGHARNVAAAVVKALAIVRQAVGKDDVVDEPHPTLDQATHILLHAGFDVYTQLEGDAPPPRRRRLRRALRTQWQQSLLQDNLALLDTAHPVPAGEALSRAAVVAATPATIVPLPRALRAPNRYQQHWIGYGAAGIALAYVLTFLYRHSPLAGSNDLQRWVAKVVHAATTAVKENVEKPLLSLQGELFKTFRDRSSIVSRQEFETDREALVRMLDDFKRDKTGRSLVVGFCYAWLYIEGVPHPVPHTQAPYPTNPRTLKRTESEVVADGMSFLMRSYEEQLVHPLRNLVTGDLARSLLIQIQKVKVDSEAAMLEIDQILRANELSISLVAAIPAILIAYLAMRGTWRLLTPTAPDPVWEALPARFVGGNIPTQPLVCTYILLFCQYTQPTFPHHTTAWP